MDRRSVLLGGLGLAGVSLAGCGTDVELKPAPFKGRNAAQARLLRKLEARGLRYGAPVHMMAYKETSEFEIWLEGDDRRFRHFKTLPICAYSGRLGPKLRRGDAQTPEGYYEINAGHMNPWSSYHLAIDIGYPNPYEKLQGRTGSLLEIHGSCISVGCYSMGNRAIEDIYLLVEQAFLQGAPRATFGAYPFRPTPARMAAAQGHVWYDYWENINRSHELFHDTGRPPYMDAFADAYVFFNG